MMRPGARIGAFGLVALVFASCAGPVRADEPPVTIKPADPPGSAPSGSQFLRPPGSSGSGSSSSSDRYEPKIDWSTLPPWQQTSFFGLRARGRVFIYVVDCSGSMGADARLLRAKAELRKSMQNLRSPQRFLIIFYNDRPWTMPGGVTMSADPSVKNQTFRWLNMIEAAGATDPRAAMAQALALRPDAVFLLSDGEFPDGTVESIARKNKEKIPIHCVDLAGGAEGDQLQKIARDSGGQYTAQP